MGYCPIVQLLNAELPSCFVLIADARSVLDVCMNLDAEKIVEMHHSSLLSLTLSDVAIGSL